MKKPVKVETLYYLDRAWGGGMLGGLYPALFTDTTWASGNCLRIEH